MTVRRTLTSPGEGTERGSRENRQPDIWIVKSIKPIELSSGLFTFEIGGEHGRE